MSEIAIRCEDLGKRYRIGTREPYRALRDIITNMMSSSVRRVSTAFSSSNSKTKQDDRTIWALKDVSFEIKHGEVVGIIGANGAGKSTLLKILSQITKPTAGVVEIHGRVGSLLEVGTGFHPELTGRENIFLNGAILGMKRLEIRRNFDAIVAFAEVEKFIDTPVKHYSSGMYVRLAFAVAAHLNPDILVVDEVLAVGDAQFQKKCLGKMDEVARSGRTIFFVSHNMGAIKALCRSALWLDAGQIKATGDCQAVAQAYLGAFDERSLTGDISAEQHIKGDGRARIEKLTLVDAADNQKGSFLIGEPFEIRLGYSVSIPVDATFWLLISTMEGTVIFSSFQKDVSAPISLRADGTMSVLLDEPTLLPGAYTISAGIFSSAVETVDWVESAIKFEVLPHFNDGRAFDHRHGLLTGKLAWRVREFEERENATFA
jgi:lipopolysaccharide transport system ATP-binding protein